MILKDAQSGSQRETVTNNEGYFTFASVPVGTYDLTVEAKGFTSSKITGISLGGGEKRNVDMSLKVGTTSETVEVTGTADQLAPVDSGEKSSTLTTKELQNYVQTGSNAAEFIKIMPGFGISNGTSNKSNYSGETIGINGNGDAGSQSPLNNAFSYNGLPTNSLDITADGAHVSDPGCNCDTPVNPNSDMISEFQVKMSNFSAENQKGPAVITSVAKSGGKDFHGSGFLYARNYAMNANDAQFNANGQPRPENKYYYPGFTDRRTGPDSRHPGSTRIATSSSSSRASNTSIRLSTPGCSAPPYRRRVRLAATSRRRNSPNWETSPLPAALPDRLRTRRSIRAASFRRT